MRRPLSVAPTVNWVDRERRLETSWQCTEFHGDNDWRQDQHAKHVQKGRSTNQSEAETCNFGRQSLRAEQVERRDGQGRATSQCYKNARHELIFSFDPRKLIFSIFQNEWDPLLSIALIVIYWYDGLQEQNWRQVYYWFEATDMISICYIIIYCCPCLWPYLPCWHDW